MTTPTHSGDSVTWQFVPGSRSDRFDRAAGSGADEIILDLKDAVSPDAKVAAGDRGLGTLTVDGQMVDRPVLARARSIMARGGTPR